MSGKEQELSPEDKLRHKLRWDFIGFYNSMCDELTRHYPNKGDSWKTMSISDLEVIADGHMMDFQKPHTIKEKRELLIDISNLCAMLWMRLTYDSSIETIIEDE